MADKRKLSGAQYCKRKAEREKEQAKQEGSFLRYLHVGPKHSDDIGSQHQDDHCRDTQSGEDDTRNKSTQRAHTSAKVLQFPLSW